MVYCSSCGKNVADNVNFCPDCGGNLTASPSHGRAYVSKQRSSWWYLAPILFSIFGGIVAYFVIKNDDPTKAKNCLVIGVILFVIGIIISAAAGWPPKKLLFNFEINFRKLETCLSS